MKRSLALTRAGLFGLALLALTVFVSYASSEAAQKQKEREPDVIFVPTPQEVVDKMLELAKVTKDDVVYDLGCGDGRIVVTAAKKYGCKATGFDIADQGVDGERQEKRRGQAGRDQAGRHLQAGLEQGQRDHALPAARPEREADPPAGQDEARLADRLAQLRHARRHARSRKRQ
jgi:predicted RNA methylase